MASVGELPAVDAAARTRKGGIGRVAACVLLSMAAGANAATRTWDGGASEGRWSSPANWDGDATAPSSGDNLVFDGSTQLATTNDLTGFSANSLTTQYGLGGTLTIAGNATGLGAGTPWPVLSGVALSRSGNSTVTGTYAGHGLAQRARVVISGAGIAAYNGTFTVVSVPSANTFTYTAGSSGTDSTTGSAQRELYGIEHLANGKTMEVNPSLTLGSAQKWQVHASALIGGNLSGSGNLEVRASDPGTSIDNVLTGLPTLRFFGNNSGYTGTITFKRLSDGSNQRSSLMLMSPAAMTGGNIDMTSNQRQALVLNGNGVSSPYTFGIGTGLGQVQVSNGDSGISPADGDVTWDPGNGGSYTWPNVAGNRIGVWSPRSGDYSVLTLGSAGQTFVLGGAGKTLAIGGSAVVRIASTLSDDGSARSLTKANNGLLILDGGSFGGMASGSTTVSAGALALSGVNQIANGNLNLNGGVLVLDGVSWTQFADDRSAGTGTNQWQATGGGFAARGADLTISGGAVTDLNADFAMGSSALDSDGTYYANRPVRVAQGVQLSATRVWKVAGNSTLAGGIYALGSLVHEVSGAISSSVGGTARQLTLNGNGSNTAGIPVLRLSGANSDLNIVTASDSSTGFGALLIPDVSSLPGTVTIQSSSPGGAGSGWLLLFEGTKTFVKDLTFNFFGTSSAVTEGLGAYAADVVYGGAVSSIGTGANTANLQWHVEAGATLTLGSFATPAHFAITRVGQGGSVVNVYRKVGDGTAVLGNVTYADGVASHYLDIRQGGLRETGSAANDSAQLTHVRLSGGVLETSNARYGAGYYNRTLSTTVGAANLNITGGGGFAAFGGPLTVDLNAAGTRDALQWNAGSFLGNNAVLVFGSLTANNVVEFYDNIKLDQSGTVTRTIRVVDNPDSAADKAVISGVINGGGASFGLEIVGDGTLELTGDNTYASSTTVRGGTVVISGSLNAGTRPVTLLTGGALGGTGTVARNIVVEAAGVIAATSATSPTGLQITGTLTVDGLIGVRLPTIAPGTYNVATASGGVTLNSTTVETLPEDFTGTAWVDGNTLKLKISSAAGPTLILVR